MHETSKRRADQSGSCLFWICYQCNDLMFDDYQHLLIVDALKGNYKSNYPKNWWREIHLGFHLNLDANFKMQSIPSPTTESSSKQSRSSYLVFSRQSSSLFLSFHWCKHIFSILRWGKIAWQSSFNTFTSRSCLSKFFISDRRISWLYFTFRKLLMRSMEMNKFRYLIIKKKKIGVNFNFSCPSLMKNQKMYHEIPFLQNN